MSDCTARLALADGTVVACQHEECYLPPEEGGGPDCVHEHDGDLGWVGWEDTTPGAYHVVECETCRELVDGSRRWWDDSTDWTDEENPQGRWRDGGCPTCDGVGWVDPPLPLGIGSVLTGLPPGAPEGFGPWEVVVVDDTDDEMVGLHSPDVVDCSDLWAERDEIGPGLRWEVVRRVWPSRLDAGRKT